jgi:phage tail protein X
VTDQLCQSTYARLGAKIERRIGEATDGLLKPGMQGFPQGNDFPDLPAGRVPAFPSHLYFMKPEAF